MPSQYVNLMPKDQDLGYQRGPRSEQQYQRRPDQAASFSHKIETLRDSASLASRLRFPTGTTKGLSLRRMPSQYVNLMPEDQDLGCQRRSRPEQPDQHRPNKAAGFLHRTERLRDSASVVSPIEFTTGTGSASDHAGAVRVGGHRELKDGTTGLVGSRPQSPAMRLDDRAANGET